MATGYDLSVATFSPDGRVFQVEYAAKTVENSGLVLGAIFKDGVLLATDKFLPSKLMLPTTATRTFRIAKHVICSVSGNLPDARQLVSRARAEAAEYEKVWGVPISGQVLADRVGLFVHAHTAVWSTRPFGCSIVLAVAENLPVASFQGATSAKQAATAQMSDAAWHSTTKKPEFSLWLIDSTGAAYKYRGLAIAKGSAGAKTDIEKLKLDELSVEQGVEDFAKILTQQHQEVSSEGCLR